MRDLMLDVVGDLEIVGGDLPLVDGADQTAQRLRTRLRLIQGEWFLDTEAGLPWFTDILGKNMDMNRTEALLRREILAVPGVLEISAFVLEFDPRSRALSLAFTARTTEGSASFEGSVP